MHPSASNFAKRFFNTYLTNVDNPAIVEVGSFDHNKTIRSFSPMGSNYIGLDLSDGPNVDIVLKDPYEFPFENESKDVVVSSSCFEHVEFFWLTFLEMNRVLKPSGLIYINTPSNFSFHRFPQDCWRFYPDSGIALEKWARKNNYNTTLLESFIGDKEGDGWRDCVMIFVKDEKSVSNYSTRISDEYKNYINLKLYNIKDLINYNGSIW